MRLAWFSPLPPHRSGIAAYSSDILAVLRARHDIEAYVDDGPGADPVHRVWPIDGVAVRGAHDFPWRHAGRPPDVMVYHLGNDVCHDYIWPYAVRYPGLVVLHDAQLHQARARGLIRRKREDRYLAEFVYSHPDADPDIGRLVLAGLGGALYYFWPMVRIPVEAARLVAVHSPWLARHLADAHPAARVTRIRMGVPDPLPAASVPAVEIRRRHGVPDDAVLFAAYGRVTPEKGLSTLLMGLSQAAARAARAHVLCVGETVDYYDVRAEAAALGVGDRITVTGYVPDADLPSYLAAADVCVCLRWPTARETSASWLRCVAAGKPTIVTDLVHTTDVPSLDLRSMRVQTVPGTRGAEPVCIAIELIDDLHMLRLALRRLTDDEALRARVGRAARAYWAEQATLDVMARDYEDALAAAAACPAPMPPAGWPVHLTADGTTTVSRIAAEVGLHLPYQDGTGVRVMGPDSRIPNPESRIPNPGSEPDVC